MARTKRPADYKVKNILEPCSRCAGQKYFNDYRANFHGGICYKCEGKGGIMVSQEQLDRREYGRKYRARKAAEKVAAKAAEIAAEAAAKLSEFEAWKVENADLVEFVSNARAGEPGTFMWDMKVRIFEEKRILTENQTKAVRRTMEQAAKDAETASPVIEGRIAITGEIISIKNQENAYGMQTKILVRDERGFKVWGTLANALADALYDAYHAAEQESRGDAYRWAEYGPSDWHQGAKGRKVTFTAKVTASDDDETFGFYNRPTKASLVEA